MEFCTEDGCDSAAIGVGYWQGRRGTENPAPPRPRRCRTHYLDLCGGEFVQFKVTGPARIIDARTSESVPAPGTVELDPVATNIRALVALEFGEIVAPKAAGKAAPVKS